MATVDSLDIQISAQVNKANASLTTLINRLDGVSVSLSGVNSRGLATMGAGVNKLANAMSNFSANTKTADFSRLSRNLASISKIDTSNFSDISSKVSQLSSAFNSFGAVPETAQQIGEFAKNISKLGNKGVQNAITNIPQLAVAMRNLMQTLSTAPAVSQNVIQMTNALANLAAQGGKVGTASRTMVSGLNNTSNAMNRAKRNSLGLAAAFGKFYATWFLAIRGIKGFMKSVESTTDYIEAYNYYNVAFGKIASEWDKDFEKYGYQNAESYAESFTKRMNQTLGKLSGVQVNLDTGLLEETGLKNLGLNIQEITQYASQLASVTNSIGQTGEVSLAAAKSMTMLAGDISSLFNIDFSDVAQNLNSALIGQSRAVYRYGIDITNATLQTYAYNLGLEKSVSEMTQAEKMQLRMLAILEQSKVSWGDLANTISSPSNMLRQFKNNVKELGMVFGQLFIPVLQKAMPIINGVTIALKRLMVAFANILGIKIDFEAFGQGYSDLGDGADDLADSLDGVAKSAKNANAGLRVFDELKVINLPDTSDKGAGAGGDMIDLTQQILDATSEYEKVWNEAFAKMESRAQEWADRIEKYLEPVKKIFKDFAIGDFFQAGQDTSALVAGIFDFFARAIDRVDWYGIGEKTGEFLAGINWAKILKSAGKATWKALKAALKTWSGAFDAAPIETGIITAIGLLKFTKLGGVLKGKINNALAKASKNLNLSSLGAAITAYFAEFTLIEDGFSGLIDGSKKLYTALTEIAAGAGIAIGALKLLGLLNPYTALLAGAIGLTGAIIGIKEGNEKLRQELRETKEIEIFGETLETAAKRVSEIVESSKKWREESQNHISSAGLAETKFLEDLAGRYFELSEKQNKSNEEMEEMKRISGLLVEKAPELQKYYNDQTGLIDANREAVEKLIDAKLDEIKLNAIGDKLSESYGNLVDLELELADAEERFTKAQDELAKLTKRKRDLEHLREQAFAVEDMARAYNNSQISAEEYNKAYEELQKLYEKLGLEHNISAITAAIQDNGKAIDEWNRTEMKSAAATWMSINNEYAEAQKYNQALMEIYTKGFSNSIDEMTGAAKQGSDELLGEISKMASGLKSIAEEMVNSTSEELGKLPLLMKEIGRESMEGFEAGIKGFASRVIDSAANVAESVAGMVKGVLKIHSPSRVMFELGDYAMQGFQEGMENLYQPILASAKAFTYDVEVAHAPDLNEISGAYKYSMSEYEQWQGISECPLSASGKGNVETNLLLRRQNELLEKILAKPNLSNGDIFNAAQSVYKGEATRRYGNSGAFDPVWG